MSLGKHLDQKLLTLMLLNAYAGIVCGFTIRKQQLKLYIILLVGLKFTLGMNSSLKLFILNSFACCIAVANCMSLHTSKGKC